MDLSCLKIVNDRKRHDQPVEYDFREIMEAVKFLGQREMPAGKTFDLSKNGLDHFYAQMIYYFFNDPACEWDLNKCLFIHGPKGTGKSVSLKIFRVLSFNGKIPSGKGFSLANCDEVVTGFEVNGPAALIKFYKGNQAFDDLGDEGRPGIHYKKELNVMKDILTRKYRGWTDDGDLTYITSNFNIDLIKTEYKSRIEDRFKEQYNDIPLKGESLR